MNQLPPALAALGAYPQFILWELRPGAPGKKPAKLPINYATGYICNAHDPAAWLTFEAAAMLATPERHIGFVFTAAAGFWFLDIDSCLTPAGWSPLAQSLVAALPGAAVEVSQSGQGLHIIGRGTCPPHACKNVALGLELYTEGRFIALTGTSAQGDAGHDCSAGLPAVVAQYFPPAGGASAGEAPAEWTTTPCEGYAGPADDAELLRRAMASTSAGVAFGGRASFADLWHASGDALARAYPDVSGVRPYDASSADAALAQHLAFWTGKDCERIRRLMSGSALRREKWDREDYLPRTILRAVGLQRDVCGSTPRLPALRGTKEQRTYADSIRSAKLATATPEQRELLTARGMTAKFWIDNREQPLDIMAAMRTPAPVAPAASAAARLVGGYQYLTGSAQLDHFKGCVYVQGPNKIFTPDGMMLNAERFNATYGGYCFQLDESGEKTTRKAWEAFTESQVARFPRVASTCFRPALPTGAIVAEEGLALVNVYAAVTVARQPGDPAPFLQHLARVLPVQRDRDLLLAYMAACVQHIGVKFQWAPLLQGVEGNGKTLFTRCVAAAIGQRYTHMPPATEVSEKFNEWLFNKLFIGIEDIYVPGDKREMIEILKPMITNDRLAMRAMQQSQVMGDNFANFMLNSNHKDAIQKTRSDRRFCVFYTAQQTADDLARDGMTGDYFPRLYSWLRAGGYAIVAEYLHVYAIPAALNPASGLHRAPETSSTSDALLSSLGAVEQEILEAIAQGRPGFAGGWVSSMAIERLLHDMHMTRAIAHSRRREMMQAIGYDLHPSLVDGRVNNGLAVEGGRKPRLYIKAGHLALNLKNPGDIANEYQRAQGDPGESAVFRATIAR